MIVVEEGREFRFRGDLYSQESTFPLVLLLIWLEVSYFILLFMTCFSIVMVLHYLYRAAVSTLFSLVVLFITYCVVKSHFILLFEQIKKKKKRAKIALRNIVS